QIARSPGQFELTPPRLAGASELWLSASAPGFARTTRRVLLLPLPFATAASTSAGPLAIEGPGRILLGSNEPIVLRLSGWSGGLPPRLEVSAGRVERVFRAGGSWFAKLAPPPTTFPGLLLVAATDEDHRVLDWMALPMFGTGQLESVAEPDVLVRIRVDGELFGPVRTDAGGTARVSIFAAPWYLVSETQVQDRAGYQVRRPLPLVVPPSARALIVCRADRRELSVLLVQDDALPRSGASVLVEAGGLRLRAEERGPGVYLGRVPEDSSFAQVRVQGDPASGGECRWQPPQPPRLGVGLRLGGGAGQGALSRSFAFLDGEFRPAGLDGRWAFGLEAGYGAQLSAEPNAPRAVSALTRLSYSPVLEPLRGYAGFSAGALWLGAQPPAPALGAFAGLSRQAGPGALTLEGSALLGRPGDADANGGHLLLLLSAGYRLEQ
ncbi:MAG: hypothetical protein ACYC8T_09775, partial [Myxococcaceae bacterium]